eukprot:ctg_2161.g563
MIARSISKLCQRHVSSGSDAGIASWEASAPARMSPLGVKGPPQNYPFSDNAVYCRRRGVRHRSRNSTAVNRFSGGGPLTASPHASRRDVAGGPADHFSRHALSIGFCMGPLRRTGDGCQAPPTAVSVRASVGSTPRRRPPRGATATAMELAGGRRNGNHENEAPPQRNEPDEIDARSLQRAEVEALEFFKNNPNKFAYDDLSERTRPFDESVVDPSARAAPSVSTAAGAVMWCSGPSRRNAPRRIRSRARYARVRNDKPVYDVRAAASGRCGCTTAPRAVAGSAMLSASCGGSERSTPTRERTVARKPTGMPRREPLAAVREGGVCEHAAT